MSFQTCHKAFDCRYKFIMSKNKIKFICVGNWVISFAIHTLIYTVFTYDAKPQTRCLVETYVQPKYYGPIYVPAIFLPLATTVALYGKIVYMLKRRSIDLASMSHNTQASLRSAEASKNVIKLAFFVTGESSVRVMEGKRSFFRTAEKTCPKPIFSVFFSAFSVQNLDVFSGFFPPFCQTKLTFFRLFPRQMEFFPPSFGDN